MAYEAIIETGGKQFAVGTGDILQIPLLGGNAGDKVTFGHVLLVRDGDKTDLGKPHVAGASVAAEILAQEKGPTLIVFKHKRRHHYKRRNGHRQAFTRVRITSVAA